MRLVSVAVWGTALVTVGLLAPGTGEATATGHGVAVKPDVARPGERVAVSVPGCAGPWSVVSEAFTGGAVDGEATVKRRVKPHTYPVVARCGSRQVTGEVRVAGRLVWPGILPSDHRD
ncbi:hypothetical protein GCM10022254_01750 [Actinomadura meridiana]|uniref:Secreted protein n=1 Tax=Actinomadura meridiana TaxID=559626 RepID=A0ABP8BRK6_9ACTN